MLKFNHVVTCYYYYYFKFFFINLQQDKGPPPVATPLEENEPENLGLHSPPPVHKKQLTAEEVSTHDSHTSF